MPEILLGRFDLGQGKAHRVGALEAGRARIMADHTLARIIACHALQHPAGLGAAARKLVGARDVEHPFECPPVPFVNRDMFEPKGRPAADHLARADKIASVEDPHVGQHVAFGRHRAIVGVTPCVHRARRVDHDRLVEDEGHDPEDGAGKDQRGKDLVGRNARGLHRDHFAVLIEPGKGDQRAE